VVSGGTAALDSAIEKKFAKKQKLLEANQRVLDGAIQYTIDQGWSEAEQPAKSTA
jgi:pyruvate ferredoxin oxidoreductase gamma subunit